MVDFLAGLFEPVVLPLLCCIGLVVAMAGVADLFSRLREITRQNPEGNSGTMLIIAGVFILASLLAYLYKEGVLV